MNGRIPVSQETRYQLKEFQSKMQCKTFEKALQLLLENAQKESFAETLLNEFECITSIEMAKKVASELFESGSPARVTVETLAQNYIKSKKD